MDGGPVRMMAGGVGDSKAPNEEVTAIVGSLRDAAQQKLGKEFAKYDLIEYKTQVVAGTNYFCKVDIGEGEFAHMRIYQPLPHTRKPAELANAKVVKNTDELSH